jgi:hypothetical protein
MLRILIKALQHSPFDGMLAAVKGEVGESHNMAAKMDKMDQ